MDPISLTGAYQGLKSAKELLGALFDAKVDAESRQRVVEIQGKLGEVQDALFVLRERLAELQQERDGLQSQLAAELDWKNRLSHYELAATEVGGVVLRFRGAPAHFACPSCVNKQLIEILQPGSKYDGSYHCRGCKSGYPVKPPAPIPLPR